VSKEEFMLRSIAFTAVAVYWTMGAAWAQTTNPAGMAPDTPRMETGNPPLDHANNVDLLFARQLSIGGRAEVDLGKLAQSKGEGAVQAFGKRMVEDHTRANDKLKSLASSIKAEIPADVDDEHKKIRADLEKRSGAEFALAYLQAQVADHQRTVQLLEWEIDQGQHDGLRKYAMDTLPVVMDHLAQAKRELMAMSASPPSDRTR
jgi:putative membrane protein